MTVVGGPTDGAAEPCNLAFKLVCRASQQRLGVGLRNCGRHLPQLYDLRVTNLKPVCENPKPLLIVCHRRLVIFPILVVGVEVGPSRHQRKARPCRFNLCQVIITTSHLCFKVLQDLLVVRRPEGTRKLLKDSLRFSPIAGSCGASKHTPVIFPPRTIDLASQFQCAVVLASLPSCLSHLD